MVECAELWIARAPDSAAPRPEAAAAIDRVVAHYEAMHATEPTAGFDAKAEAWRARARP